MNVAALARHMVVESVELALDHLHMTRVAVVGLKVHACGDERRLIHPTAHVHADIAIQSSRTDAL